MGVGTATSNLSSIDFGHSSMRWVTKSLRSDGSFRVEAALSLSAPDGRHLETFALGAGVIAGEMFASDGLAKRPLYHFQVAASGVRHVIYRTYLRDMQDEADATGADTAAGNDELFESLEIGLATAPARVLETYGEIADAYDRGDVCNGVVEIETVERYRLRAEFPLKHLNLLRERAMFQVETGPILFADPAAAGARFCASPGALVPCFVHFNRLDRVDVTFDFPFGRRRSQADRDDVCVSVNCSARLLASAAAS